MLYFFIFWGGGIFRNKCEDPGGEPDDFGNFGKEKGEESIGQVGNFRGRDFLKKRRSELRSC